MNAFNVYHRHGYRGSACGGYIPPPIPLALVCYTPTPSSALTFDTIGLPCSFSGSTSVSL